MDDVAPKPGEATSGEPPGSNPHINGPGMTNGVPDGASEEAATGAPRSDRKETETAGGGGGSGG